MSRVCEVCGKGTSSGNNRSHSMRATKRVFKANILIKNEKNEEGINKRKKICSRCYKRSQLEV